MEKTYNLEVPNSSPGWSTLKIKRVCQNVHTLFFMHKAPTFSSQGFAIS